MNILISGFRNNLTTLFGAIPGAVVAIGELLDAIDGNEKTAFEFKVFALAAATAVAFFLSRDASKTSEQSLAK